MMINKPREAGITRVDKNFSSLYKQQYTRYTKTHQGIEMTSVDKRKRENPIRIPQIIPICLLIADCNMTKKKKKTQVNAYPVDMDRD
jgi:hypothetical protein